MKRSTALALLFVFVLSCDARQAAAPPSDSVKAERASTDRQATVFETQDKFREIAKKAMPAVGYVYSLKAEKAPSFRSLLGSGLGLLRSIKRYVYNRAFVKYRVQGSGSAFLINKRGHMLTNYHVVKDADIVLVKMDGEELDAVVLGSDPLSDIAMIKIRYRHDNRPLKLGNSDTVEIGEWVLAIGNPFSLGRTFTVGVISGLKRDDIGIIELEDFIQTDAAIHPGNSGGPLLNMDGEVIGINSAIYSGGGGLGFAIPVNMAHGILPMLVSGEKVERGMLGVGLQQLNRDLASALKMEPNSGVLVSMVQGGMPADSAGLKAGDVIVKINGRRVTQPLQIKKSVLTLKAGSKVRLDVIRDGTEMVFNPTLAPFEPLF